MLASLKGAEGSRNLLISATSRKLKIRNTNRCSTELDNLVFSQLHLVHLSRRSRNMIPEMTFCAIASGCQEIFLLVISTSPSARFRSSRTSPIKLARPVQIAPSENDNYAKKVHVIESLSFLWMKPHNLHTILFLLKRLFNFHSVREWGESCWTRVI